MHCSEFWGEDREIGSLGGCMRLLDVKRMTINICE